MEKIFGQETSAPPSCPPPPPRTKLKPLCYNYFVLYFHAVQRTSEAVLGILSWMMSSASEMRKVSRTVHTEDS